MGIVFAVQSCSARGPHGSTVRVREGEAWDAEDPFVALHPHLFSPEPRKVRRSVPAPVEEATAVPGEKRRRK